MGGVNPVHAEEENPAAAAAAAADAPDAPDATIDETPPLPDFAKMRVKELRAIVEDRGMQCKGCAEKADYVERAAEAGGAAHPIVRISARYWQA